MKSRQGVICPKCGALNRPTWEFCARCSESLEGARPAAEGTPSAASGTGPAEAAGSSAWGANLFAVLLGLALVAGGAWAWRSASRADAAPGPDPAIFRIASQAPDLPSPPPPSAVGAADYAEARRLLHGGDLPAAIARFAAAVRADPQNAEYQVAYGIALWRSGDADGAIAAHAQAARLDPRQEVQYARTLDIAGRSAEATAQYEVILAKNPAAAAVREDLGRLLFRTGNYARAATLLEKAVEARPDDPVLQQEFAYSVEQTGDRAQAASVYQQVLAKAPQAVITRGLLADNLVEQGRKDEAVALLKDGLRLTPGAPLLQRQMGSVLERSGQRGAAAVAYREYARLAPNAQDAHELVERASRLEAAEGKP